MRIAVMGSGGVGGYFGGLLARANEDVTFIARGAHLEAIQKNGLQVKSVVGDFHVRPKATHDPSAVGPADLVLFSVKSYDTEAAGSAIRPMVGRETVVLCLLNGVDNEEKLEAILGEAHVMAGVVHILSTISAPGVISQIAGPRTIKLGEKDGRITPRVERILGVLKGANILADISTQIQVDLWEKFLFICAQGGVTALGRLSVGEILASPETAAFYRGVMEEVAAVGRAKGVALPADAVDRALAFARGLQAGTRSSLAHDLIQGNRLEVETLAGSVVRYGREVGVPTPLNFAIYACLKPHHDKALAARPA
ncbi:MAG TPA: ketopantoate reductase family protein [Candidatus Methylomirabilis sp.]|nr:ketopantoate reductase family protein [Candidatus Methylomirabilis sp.]